MLSYSPSDIISPLYPYPGGRTYVFPNDNPFPATLWYHDHGEDVTAANVYKRSGGILSAQAEPVGGG